MPENERRAWWECYPNVFLEELKQIQELGKHFRPRFEQRSADSTSTVEQLVVRGRIRVKATRPGEHERWHGLDIDVIYPPTYPFDLLDVRPVDPSMRYHRHQARLSGNICYMQEELESWALGSGIKRAIEGTKQWFRGVVMGHFDNEVPAPELPAYFKEQTRYIRALLLPDHMMEEAPPARHGQLELEWDGELQGIALASVASKRKHGKPKRDEGNTPLWRALRFTGKPALVPGLWFALDREPPPFSDLAGLQDVLHTYARISPEQFRTLALPLLDPQQKAIGWLPIGINYPGRPQADEHSQREWVFCCLEWPDLNNRLRKARRLRPQFWSQARLRGVAAYPVRRADFVRRRGAYYPAEGIDAAHVMVVGVGALGSTVARSLTAAGVGRVTLVEFDVMKPGNVMRNELRMPDIGKLKAPGMQQVLYETNPYVNVETIAGTRLDAHDFEQALLSREHPPTLVVATVALRAVDGQIDAVAQRAEPPIPVLHAWVMAQAQVLRAFLYRPGQTACVWCDVLYAGDREAGSLNNYITEPAVNVEPIFEAGCGSPAFPGAGNTNALAAHIIVEMALDTLHHRLPDDQTHWVFAGNRIYDLDPEFPVKPLTIERRGFEPHPECPLCKINLLSSRLTGLDHESYYAELARVRYGM